MVGCKLLSRSVIDASAKIPSGLLRGNVNQLGDFDQCMEIRTKIKLKDDKSVKIRGKYCLANIDVEATIDEMRLPVHLLQGRNMLRSHLDDVSLIGFCFISVHIHICSLVCRIIPACSLFAQIFYHQVGALYSQCLLS